MSYLNTDNFVSGGGSLGTDYSKVPESNDQTKEKTKSIFGQRVTYFFSLLGNYAKGLFRRDVQPLTKSVGVATTKTKTVASEKFEATIAGIKAILPEGVDREEFGDRIKTKLLPFQNGFISASRPGKNQITIEVSYGNGSKPVPLIIPYKDNI